METITMPEIVSTQSAFMLSNDGHPIPCLIISYKTQTIEEDEIFGSISTKINKMLYRHPDDNVDVTEWITRGKISVEPKIAADIFEQIKSSFDLTAKIMKAPDYNEDINITEYCRQTPSSYDKEIEKLRETLNKAIEKLSSTTSGDLTAFLSRYKNKKHILIKGEKGVGKTYQVDKYVKSQGMDMVFIAGNEGLESIDLLGYYTKDSIGNYVWMDGVLSEAFRIAQKKPVCLVFDEILRTKAKELNILVGSLTPDSSGNYKLRTNRIIGVEDGIGKTEIIEVPQENLWVIGTTNVGSKYNIEDIDDALNDRFRIFHKVATESEIKAIIKFWLDIKSFPEAYVEKFYSLYEKIQKLFESGELQHQINARHLAETIQFSEKEKDFKVYLQDLVPNLCSTNLDGKPNQIEFEIITRAIKTTF